MAKHYIATVNGATQFFGFEPALDVGLPELAMDGMAGFTPDFGGLAAKMSGFIPNPSLLSLR
jgi:hypothetical protein